jgi:hypothetical protein
MVFNQNHASILYFVSSIIIIVGLPTGFYLMFRMLDVIDHIKYASTEIGEGFMVGLQNGLNETFLNSLAKQITHTVVISAMIYRDPPQPLLQHI